MIILGMLTIIGFLIAISIVCVTMIGGGIGIIIFSDLIVCIAILVWGIKKLANK